MQAARTHLQKEAAAAAGRKQRKEGSSSRRGEAAAAEGELHQQQAWRSSRREPAESVAYWEYNSGREYCMQLNIVHALCVSRAFPAAFPASTL